jgi:hypothetical protein
MSRSEVFQKEVNEGAVYATALTVFLLDEGMAYAIPRDEQCVFSLLSLSNHALFCSLVSL